VPCAGDAVCFYIYLSFCAGWVFSLSRLALHGFCRLSALVCIFISLSLHRATLHVSYHYSQLGCVSCACRYSIFLCLSSRLSTPAVQ